MSYKTWLQNLEKEIEEVDKNITFKEAWSNGVGKFKKELSQVWRKGFQDLKNTWKQGREQIRDKKERH